jgi:hypothetical protein
MKMILNFCAQGNVENPCNFRTVIPTYDEQKNIKYIKVCTSKILTNCCKVTEEIDVQSPHITSCICGPVE